MSVNTFSIKHVFDQV